MRLAPKLTPIIFNLYVNYMMYYPIRTLSTGIRTTTHDQAEPRNPQQQENEQENDPQLQQQQQQENDPEAGEIENTEWLYFRVYSKRHNVNKTHTSQTSSRESNSTNPIIKPPKLNNWC